jgi:hypothetical protein
MLVVAQVSSMNTSRSGLNSGCRARQARRAAATSGRSCSAACWVFFSRQPGGGEEAANPGPAGRDPLIRQPVAQLGDREVRLGRQQRAQSLAVRRERGPFPAPDPVRLDRAALVPALHQLDHAADADLELGRGRPARCPGRDRAHHPLAQIHGIRSCPSSLASFIQQPV